MLRLLGFLIIIFVYNSLSIAMENKPYHHLPDGTFRNPEGSPRIEDFGFNWSFRVFNKEKKKINIDVPADHIINKKEVLENIKKNKNKFTSGTSLRLIAGSTYLLGPKIKGPIFFSKTGSVIIVVLPSLIKNVACPIQAT